MAGRKRTPGEEELERENARRQAEIDAGQADYRHLLHGVSAFNFIEKVSHHKRELSINNLTTLTINAIGTVPPSLISL